MTNDPFKEAYGRLNAAQKEAVDTIEGPVMVIAGPGTGKTQILTLRIANILLKTDVSPENILALTFTESGTRAMRERLHTYIGSRAYRASIHTFHEFAGSLINAYPDAYDRAVGGRPATDLEKVGILEDLIETGKVRALRPHGNHSFYIQYIMSAIALMKREYITPDSFSAIIAEQEAQLSATPKVHEKGAHKGKVRSEYQKMEKDLEKNKELLFLYRAYDAALTSRNLYDFEDMIFETVRALERNEDMLRDLQERFQYILADEHQDVNGSQNKILELLASFHERPNLFVVGDEKQAIYRFQGASLENFLYFEERFPHTKTIALTDNYRSTQPILDLSHELITAFEGPASDLRVKLTACAKVEGVIERRHFGHESIEDETTVTMVEALIGKGVPPEEIAIIVRSNKEVEAFASALRSKSIPVNATADGDILYHPITSSVRSLLTATVQPSNEEALFAVLHAPYWGIHSSDLIRVLRERSYDRPLTRIIGDTDFLKTLNLQSAESFMHIGATLDSVRSLMVSEAPHRVLQSLLKGSGFIDHVLAEDPEEGGRVVRRLYDEIESLVMTREITSLEGILRMFSLRIEHGLSLSAPYIHTHTHAVQVMTAHKSKGLEFDHVFLPHLVDSKWGGTTKPVYFNIPITKHLDPGTFEPLDDERKLLYVAITRARKSLYLSSSDQSSEGRAFSPTRLLEDVSESLMSAKDTTIEEESFNPLSSLSSPMGKVTIDIELLRTVLTERGISSTSLNNYLKSPWNYFYRNVLRVPEMQTESALFGTALHNALRRITMYRSAHGDLPSISLIKTYLENEIGRLPLTVHEYTRLHERGLEALSTYLECVKGTLPAKTREEVKLEAYLETGDVSFPRVLLTGMLDRLDHDAEGNVLRVVDYKSGRPKTRGYIEGTTKDSTGDYKRQLTFYALLLSLQENNELRTRNGLLSFVEADEKGKIHEEAYTITDEEIAALTSEIIRVVLEIAHGAFLNAPCDPLMCDYCHLVELLADPH